MAGQKRGNGRPIIVRREEVIEGGHHGGAWKVAYADFVTAMMAFFLLMWLLNATTEAQRKGLADYFSPSNELSHQSSGTGKPFGGQSPLEDGAELSNKGAKAIITGPSPAPADSQSDDPADGNGDTRPNTAEDGHAGQPAQVAQQGKGLAGGGQATATSLAPARADYLAQAGSGSAPSPNAEATDPAQLSDTALRAELARREQADFERAAQAIRQAVAAEPGLADLSRQLLIESTPRGLRIQILDAERAPMFASGSAVLSDRAQQLIVKIAPVLARLKQPVEIAGHTDSAAYHGAGMTNWELSSDRANATRRLLAQSGLEDSRFRSVSGEADREPLLPAQPLDPSNRRIAITVLRSAASAPATQAAPGGHAGPEQP